MSCTFSFVTGQLSCTTFYGYLPLHACFLNILFFMHAYTQIINSMICPALFTQSLYSVLILVRQQILYFLRLFFDRFEVKEIQWGQYFPVTEGAKQARATERLDQLSEPKKYHKVCSQILIFMKS